VRDYRLDQIEKLHEIVEIFRESEMAADSVLEVGYQQVVVVARGSHWRKDGMGRTNTIGSIPGSEAGHVITASDVLAGVMLQSPVVVFDDEHHYLGGAIAEKLLNDGLAVTLMTPAPVVSAWSEETLDQDIIQSRLVELGVDIVTGYNLTAIETDRVEVGGVYDERARSVKYAAVVMVTSRIPKDGLYYGLKNRPAALAEAGISTIKRIGDALGPGLIAAAVWSGHRYARELDAPPPGDVPFKRELVVV